MHEYDDYILSEEDGDSGTEGADGPRRARVDATEDDIVD